MPSSLFSNPGSSVVTILTLTSPSRLTSTNFPRPMSRASRGPRLGANTYLNSPLTLISNASHPSLPSEYLTGLVDLRRHSNPCLALHVNLPRRARPLNLHPHLPEYPNSQLHQSPMGTHSCLPCKPRLGLWPQPRLNLWPNPQSQRRPPRPPQVPLPRQRILIYTNSVRCSNKN